MSPSSRRGAALPSVLLLVLWLTGITGWLLAHATWDRQMSAATDDYHRLLAAADGMTDALAASLAHVPDWSPLLPPGPPEACPGTLTVMAATAEIAAESARLQATTAMRSRWAAPHAPQWRFLSGCHAAALQTVWRGQGSGPLVLAWIADDPDDTVTAPYAHQVMIHVLARRVSAPGARATVTATLRRAQAGSAPRVVAWRLE